MNANEILPAIPRQKVRRISRPEVIAEVMRHDVMHPEWVHVHEIDYPGSEVVSWNIKDCEPVPEEPRPLRVGDKVVTHSGTLTKIEAIMRETDERHSYRVQHSDYDFYQHQLRHATPQEIKEYFACA